MKTNGTMILVAVLLIIVVVLAGYIVVDKYAQKKQQEKDELLKLGMQQGVEQAVIAVMQQASTCQQVPLTYGNTTMNIIAVDCLKQQQ